MSEDPLVKQLKEGNAEQRREAAKYLEQRTIFDWVSDRDERDISFAIPALMEALHDDDRLVRENALSAITSALGDRQDVECAIPSMLDILTKQDPPELMAGAAHFLKNIADQGIDMSPHVDVLKSLLRKDGADDAILGATDSLALHFIKKKIWDELCLLLKHENKEVRQEAAGTIQHAWVREFQPNIKHALEMLLIDPDVELQLVSARTLAPSIQDASDATLVLDTILRYTNHPEKRIRNHALLTVGTIMVTAVRCKGKYMASARDSISRAISLFEGILSGGPDEMKAFVAKHLTIYWVHIGAVDKVRMLLEHPLKAVVDVTFSNIGNCDVYGCDVPLTPYVDILITIALKTSDAKHRFESFIRYKRFDPHILDNIIKIYDIDDIWDIVKTIRETVNSVRINGLNAKLGKIPDGDKTNVLIEIAGDENSAIREWAFHRMSELGSFYKVSIKRAIGEVLRHVDDPDPFVRMRVTECILPASGKRHESRGLAGLVTLLDDPVSHVRDAAATSLMQGPMNGTGTGCAIDKLARLLHSDPSDDIRAHAAIAIYEHAKHGGNVESSTIEAIVKGLEDKHNIVRNFCEWMLTRHVINPGNAGIILDGIKKHRLNTNAPAVATVIKRIKDELEK